MKSAKELTAIVAESKADRENFKGVSDHCPHAQLLEFRKGERFPNGLKFVLATFNVLNPAYMFYQNGITLDGTPLPAWLKMEDQAGLEHLPSSDPRLQPERELRVRASIAAFVKQHKTAVVCLQECWRGLYEGLVLDLRDCVFFKDQTSEKSFRLTIVRGLPDCETVNPECTSIRFARHIIVHNVHMAFATQKSIDQVKTCLAMPLRDAMLPVAHCHHFIVGDFNVQTQPLSERVKEEGVCTETLVEFASHFNDPLFLVHPSGWTNWNVRKNCANPDKNWDHFDNIMLWRHAWIELPASAPVQWDVIMQ
jgi:hypothetical protein